MSGYVPGWIERGKKVLYKGKPRVIKDWFFTSAPGPNNDRLNVVLEGIEGAFSFPDIKPLVTPEHPMDEDVTKMSHLRAMREVMRLRNAIRMHRDAKNNARCWLNDFALYRLLPERSLSPSIILRKHEFLKNCDAYFERQRRKKNKKFKTVAR